VCCNIGTTSSIAIARHNACQCRSQTNDQNEQPQNVSDPDFDQRFIPTEYARSLKIMPFGMDTPFGHNYASRLKNDRDRLISRGLGLSSLAACRYIKTNSSAPATSRLNCTDDPISTSSGSAFTLPITVGPLSRSIIPTTYGV
jgi:hypothetical protein